MIQIICSACEKLIPEHELSSITDEKECLSCEMKFRDSADLDNLF